MIESVADVATKASQAEPPARSALMPDSTASGWPATTMARGATTAWSNARDGIENVTDKRGVMAARTGSLIIAFIMSPPDAVSNDKAA
jgi:hypothetical protein